MKTTYPNLSKNATLPEILDLFLDRVEADPSPENFAFVTAISDSMDATMIGLVVPSDSEQKKQSTLSACNRVIDRAFRIAIHTGRPEDMTDAVKIHGNLTSYSRDIRAGKHWRRFVDPYQAPEPAVNAIRRVPRQRAHRASASRPTASTAPPGSSDGPSSSGSDDPDPLAAKENHSGTESGFIDFAGESLQELKKQPKQKTQHSPQWARGEARLVA